MRRLKSSKIKTPSSRALILYPDVDSLRRDYIRNYHSQAQFLKEVLQHLQDHEERDMPAFRRWFDGTFVKEREALFDTVRQVEVLEDIFAAAEDYRECKGGTWATALIKVKEASDQGALDELMEAVAKELAEESSWASELDDEDAFKKEFYDLLFGEEDEHVGFSAHEVEDDFEGSFYGEKWSERPNDEQECPSPSKERDSHFKALYRKLVKKLHPDFCPDQTVVQKAIWHELQRAYEWNDLSKLEELDRKLNGAAAVGLDLWLLPLAELAFITRQLTGQTLAGRQRLERESSMESWDFVRFTTDRRHLEKLKTKIKRSLEFELEMAAMTLRNLKHEFSRRTSPRKPRPKKPKAKPQQRKKPPLYKQVATSGRSKKNPQGKRRTDQPERSY